MPILILFVSAWVLFKDTFPSYWALNKCRLFGCCLYLKIACIVTIGFLMISGGRELVNTVKSVRIRRFSGLYFPAFAFAFGYGHISRSVNRLNSFNIRSEIRRWSLTSANKFFKFWFHGFQTILCLSKYRLAFFF